MNRIVALVVAVVVVLFIGSSMMFVVDERHAGVVSAHGGGTPTLVTPGLHFKLPPPFQTLTLIDTRTLTLDEAGSDRFNTSDKNEVIVNTVIKYRVADPLKLFESNEKNTQTAQDRLAALTRTALTSAFTKRSLANSDYVYVWVDGIHLKVRLEQDKVCLLVMIGVRADGRKELVGLADGFRESSQSWADLLRSCRRRGMTAPVLAVGDGALGFWKAVREVFPDTREQRCWFHRQANVLADVR